ncbi:MAG: type 2 isopentenyl-diphosphate Delta-isomerase [Ignavibacteriales bacterium]|nr:type 2 isopentenyl-diphosphate Delta-isomerase [Ignavibacteriales bacterium]
MQEDDLQERKRSHLTLCETSAVAFKAKTAGFEFYDFIHCAITEVDTGALSLDSDFFGKKTAAPFIISCMTGGVNEADNINLQLAEAAKELRIPLGLGSLRYALGNHVHDTILRQIRGAMGDTPVMANLGAAQIISNAPAFTQVLRLVDVLQPDVFVVHVNPLQELLQKNGEPKLTGFLQALEQFIKIIGIPVIIKEVGSGIAKAAAKTLLNCGVRGIDTAGAGGTSWAGVEILRNNSPEGTEFWDWGIPTAYSIKTIAKLKKKFDFTLIGSGGVNTPLEAAKALALGANFAGSARIFFHALKKGGVNGVIQEIQSWESMLKKVLYLTGCASLTELSRHNLIEKKDFH